MSGKNEIEKIVMTNHEKITEIHHKVNELYKYVLGNGQPGMYQEFNQFKGSIKMFKWIAGSGGFMGLIALISSLIR